MLLARCGALGSLGDRGAHSGCCDTRVLISLSSFGFVSWEGGAASPLWEDREGYLRVQRPLLVPCQL